MVRSIVANEQQNELKLLAKWLPSSERETAKNKKNNSNHSNGKSSNNKKSIKPNPKHSMNK